MSDALNAALSIVRSRAIRYDRFAWTDNAGLIRAKAVHTAFLADYVGDGVGVTAGGAALPVMYDAVAPGAGLTAAGEVHLRPDWATFSPLPYAPGHARVFTDGYQDEQPWPHCPRHFLRRMIDRLAGHGLRLLGAFENEFYLLRPDGDGFAPVDASVFCQTAALDGMAAVLDEITAALEAQGLLAEQLYPESGPGQFELPVRYADALAAADHQVVLRETVRAVARRHGLLASFVPKIFLDKTGSGAHLHFSLWRDGQNVIPDASEPRAMSAEAGAFAAGLLRHLPALMALTTPSTNSYKRIRPRFWSGAFTCWGFGNREAAVRVPPTPGRQPITNLELKTVDPTCNPYLALGAVIAAGLDGLEQRLDPGEPVRGDPADLSDAELAARGIRRLPTSLAESIGALEQDGVLLDALGPDLARSLLAVRRFEWETMKDMSHEEEVRLLVERF